jgi:CubicO group peptidase (beta-lactamase class C family)
MKTRVIQKEPDGPPVYELTDRPSDAPVQSTDSGGRSGRRRKIAILGLAVLLVLVGAYLASRPGATRTGSANGVATGDPNLAAIDTFVEGEMGAQRIPGLALGIVQGDQVIHMRGFGDADSSGGEVTPQTPFIIGSVAKSFTALAVMQLVEAGKIDLDAPVQRYLPWFRVADEQASAKITVRHLLNQTSGLSTKTGRSFQGSGDTSDGALEKAVRKLRTAELTAPVGAKHQYSTINYSVLGLIVQTVSGQSYETYVQKNIFDPLRMGNSFTSEAAAQSHGLATGRNYWFGRPRVADEPYNRGLIPAGYLISSAEDMTHYLIAQLNDGRYGGSALLSPSGIAELHRAAVATPAADTSYGMGWFVGPINGIPVVFHQGETFTYHANAVLVPRSKQGVIVLMNAENSLDLFTRGRMATVAEGVVSLLQGQEPPSPPSRLPIFVAYALLLAVIAVQLGGMIRSVAALRRGRAPRGRLGPWWHLSGSLLLNLGWAALILILVPQRMLGLPLTVLAQGLPDFAYVLLVSGLVAVGWAIVRFVWTYLVLRAERRGTETVAATT